MQTINWSQEDTSSPDSITNAGLAIIFIKEKEQINFAFSIISNIIDSNDDPVSHVRNFRDFIDYGREIL